MYSEVSGGCSSMVEHRSVAAVTGVRFPSLTFGWIGSLLITAGSIHSDPCVGNPVWAPFRLILA